MNSIILYLDEILLLRFLHLPQSLPIGSIGKDVTRSLCLGRKESEYLIRSTEGLDEKQINEGKRWLSFFHVHDKYHHIGNLEKIDSEAWLDALIEDTLSNNNDDIVNDEDDDEYYDDDEDDGEDDDDDSEDINSQQSEEQ